MQFKYQRIWIEGEHNPKDATLMDVSYSVCFDDCERPRAHCVDCKADLIMMAEDAAEDCFRKWYTGGGWPMQLAIWNMNDDLLGIVKVELEHEPKFSGEIIDES